MCLCVCVFVCVCILYVSVYVNVYVCMHVCVSVSCLCVCFPRPIKLGTSRRPMNTTHVVSAYSPLPLHTTIVPLQVRSKIRSGGWVYGMLSASHTACSNTHLHTQSFDDRAQVIFVQSHSFPPWFHPCSTPPHSYPGSISSPSHPGSILCCFHPGSTPPHSYPGSISSPSHPGSILPPPPTLASFPGGL